MSDLDEFYVHTVAVETYRGTNGYGADTFDPPVPVQGYLEDADRIIRTADSVQETAESAFYTSPEHAPLFVLESRVTVGENVARVIRVSPFTSGDLDLPDHVLVLLGSTRTR